MSLKEVKRESEVPVHAMCNALKDTYDKCFNTWFAEKYVTGQERTLGCQNEYDAYQECVKVLFALFRISLHAAFCEILTRTEKTRALSSQASRRAQTNHNITK